MNDLETKTLAQIVNGNYRAALVFERYHLDFCCKGKRTLQQACEESDLQLDEVLSALENTEQGNAGSVGGEFGEMSLTQLADHIVATHHSYVKAEIPAILGYLQKVAAKHGDHHPEMIKVLQLFSVLIEEMEQHMQKEEIVLFPRVKEAEKKLAAGTDFEVASSFLLSPINMLEQEHDHAGSLLSEIRTLTLDYYPPADACTTYRLSLAALQAFELDLHQHVHLENNMLFPKALLMFEQSKQCSLN